MEESEYLFVAGGNEDNNWEWAMRGHGPMLETYLRFVGHMIFHYMPSSGLTETIDTLYDLYKFYSVEPPKMLPQATTHDIIAVTR